MRSIVSSSLSLLLVLALSGCTRIETGEAGLRVDFSGTIQPTVVPPGIHQTLIGHIILFAAKEILLQEENLTPQTRDKTTLNDFDINFTYAVDPSYIPELYIKYSRTAHLQARESDEIFPMGAFVAPIVRASAYSAVAEYDALTVNDHRKEIEDKTRAYANQKLEQEGLGGKVKVNLVNIRNIQLAPEIVASANRVVQTQNDLKTKTTEVQIANQEALRIETLAKQTNAGYTQLLNAQAAMTVAQALQTAAGRGSTIWVVPNNFISLGNTAAAGR